MKYYKAYIVIDVELIFRVIPYYARDMCNKYFATLSGNLDEAFILHHSLLHYTDVIWASWCLKSMEIWMFAQQAAQANKQIRSSPLVTLWKNTPPGTDGFSSTTASNVERFSMSTLLAHLLLAKIATISQTIFSDVFLWMKGFVFRSKFHLSLLLVVQLTITQH